MNIQALESELETSVSWRKQELQQARFLATEATDLDRPYLCRAWTLVMYAHCDQFLKETARTYLNYLQNNPRVSYDYFAIWRAFKSKQLMLEAKDGDNFEQLINPDNIEKKLLIKSISDKSVIESGSFNYKRLRFFVAFILQIEFSFVDYKGFCNTLKIRRDEIAHGEQSTVQQVSDCLAWHVPTLQLLDGLVDGVLEAARNG